MIKCPVCGAELARGTPFCPVCGASLSFTFRPVLFALIYFLLCAAALYVIPRPYSFFACAPFLLLGLLAFGAGSLGAFRALRR